MSFTDDLTAIYGNLKAIAVSRVTRYAGYQEAEEVLHDTLIRCMELRNRFEEGTNLITWCVAVMKNIEKERNTSAQKYRQRFSDEQEEENDLKAGYTETNTDGAPIGDVLDRGIFDSETNAAKSDLEEIKTMSIRKDILECLKELSEIAQQTFLLNTVLGYKGKEVAEKLDEAYDAVKQRLARSRKSVGLCLSQKMEAQA